VDLSWAHGEASQATLRAGQNEMQRLRPPKGQRIVAISSKGEPISFTRDGDDGCIKFQSGAGIEYNIKFE